jgi:hypothetical protein
MSGLPWFRLYAEFAFDPEIQSLAFEDQRHFVMVLCLKCSGILDKDHAVEQRQKVVSRALGLYAGGLEEAKRRLIEAGLIDDDWQPCNWKKRQYLSDTSTDRVRKHRASKGKNIEPGNATLQKHPQIQITDSDSDTEAEEREDRPLSGTAIAPLADPLSDPFAGTDPLRDTKPSRDTKTEEKAVGREHLKRTKVNDVELVGTIPYDDIAKLYVDICMPAGFLEFKYLTEGRRREIHNRWLEVAKRRDLEWWRKYFGYCASCEGLKGKSWANFAFLISDKMVDITEGKYEREFARQHRG